MNYLLDTCVISELVKKTPNVGLAAWFGRSAKSALYVSSVTIGELQKGIAKLGETKRANVLQKWLDGWVLPFFAGRVLPISVEEAKVWGRLCGASMRQGRPRPAADALIAATASLHKMTLVTRNVEDMAGMGAPLLNPFSGSPAT